MVEKWRLFVMLNCNWYICTTHKISSLVLTGISLFAIYVSYFQVFHLLDLSTVLVFSMNWQENDARWFAENCKQQMIQDFIQYCNFLLDLWNKEKLLDVKPLDFRWEVIRLHVLSLHFRWSNIYAYQEILEINSYPAADTDSEPMWTSTMASWNNLCGYMHFTPFKVCTHLVYT